MRYFSYSQCSSPRQGKGEKVMTSLLQFCDETQLLAASVSGIGVKKDVTPGFFDPASKTYHASRMQENFEIAFLSGSVFSVSLVAEKSNGTSQVYGNMPGFSPQPRFPDLLIHQPSNPQMRKYGKKKSSFRCSLSCAKYDVTSPKEAS